MVFETEITHAAAKDLARLPRNRRDQIIAKIATLQADAGRGNAQVTALQGRDDYRLRVGDFRVLFSVNHTAKIILIEAIKPRGRAYQ